jgi:hypothetical protein
LVLIPDLKNQPDETSKSAIVGELTALQSEYAQLSELEEMEQTYVVKLIDALKVLQAGVDVALSLHKEALGPAYSSAKDAHLASEGVVIVTSDDGKMSSLPLSKFQTKVVLDIVEDATPELGRIIAERRKGAGARVELLERILKELKKASSLMKQGGGQAAHQPVEDDLVQNSITS